MRVHSFNPVCGFETRDDWFRTESLVILKPNIMASKICTALIALTGVSALDPKPSYSHMLSYVLLHANVCHYQLLSRNVLRYPLSRNLNVCICATAQNDRNLRAALKPENAVLERERIDIRVAGPRLTREQALPVPEQILDSCRRW